MIIYLLNFFIMASTQTTHWVQNICLGVQMFKRCSTPVFVQIIAIFLPSSTNYLWQRLLKTPQVRTKFDERAFCYYALKSGILYPKMYGNANQLTPFRKTVKTHLFSLPDMSNFVISLSVFLLYFMYFCTRCASCCTTLQKHLYWGAI